MDVVLLSHDQHPDNLDHGGRDYVDTARLVLSTRSAEERLGGAVLGLPNWVSQEFDRPGGGTALVTGVPALHGPEGSEPVVGEVTGFVLTGEDLPTVYISGDNASLDRVREIAARYAPVDVALLFAGGARTPLLDYAYLTLTSAEAAEAATILQAGAVVPLHFEQWAHFSEGGEAAPAGVRGGRPERPAAAAQARRVRGRSRNRLVGLQPATAQRSRGPAAGPGTGPNLSSSGTRYRFGAIHPCHSPVRKTIAAVLTRIEPSTSRG